MKFGLDHQQNFLKKDKMKEKEIKVEKVESKKRTFKPKNRVIKEVEIKEVDDIDNMVMRSEEVYPRLIKKQKQVGSYRIGKSFHVFFEKKPSQIHRFFTRILLGWKWVDNN